MMDFDDSYLDAQRAAVESVAIGRNTLEQAQQQNEQLHRASSIADETQYSLDQAARLLKNMTWSGWIANKFSKDPRALRESTRIEEKSDASITSSSSQPIIGRQDEENSMDARDVPKSCQAVFQAVQNYRANLKVLQDCDQKDQLETCQTICNTMYEAARAKLAQLAAAKTCDSPVEKALCLQLEQDLSQCRQRQAQVLAWQSQHLSTNSSSQSTAASTAMDIGNAEAPFSSSHARPVAALHASASSSDTTTAPALLQQQRKQDEHLDFISGNLQELGHLAQNLHEAVHTSNRTMDRLEDQSETMLEQTRHVTRRADRLARHKKGWVSRAVSSGVQLLGRVAIQHVESGRYVRVLQGTVFLVPNLDKATCTMGVYSSQRVQAGKAYGLVGIKNIAEGAWLGQSFLGSLDASAATFGHRQEWEMDDGVMLGSDDGETSRRSNNDTDKPARTTRLLCASAGWGNGGYLMVGPAPHFAITIGGSTVDDKKKAAIWRLVDQPL